jgi:hypothetical protein
MAAAVSCGGSGSDAGGTASTTSSAPSSTATTTARVGCRADELACVAANIRNAAVAEETYLTDNNSYATTVEELETVGFVPDEGVTLRLERVTADAYCIEATVGGREISFDSRRAGNRVLPQAC